MFLTLFSGLGPNKESKLTWTALWEEKEKHYVWTWCREQNMFANVYRVQDFAVSRRRRDRWNAKRLFEGCGIQGLSKDIWGTLGNKVEYGVFTNQLRALRDFNYALNIIQKSQLYRLHCNSLTSKCQFERKKDLCLRRNSNDRRRSSKTNSNRCVWQGWIMRLLSTMVVRGTRRGHWAFQSFLWPVPFICTTTKKVEKVWDDIKQTEVFITLPNSLIGLVF